MSNPRDHDHELDRQAAELESLLPRAARRLFTLGEDDPSAELPLTQLRVCSFLAAGPSPMSAMADELAVSVSAATQLADRLERAGLVTRVSDPADRRVKLLSLTSEGVALMERRQRLRVGRVREALSHLSRPERAEVLNALHTLLAASLRVGGRGRE